MSMIPRGGVFVYAQEGANGPLVPGARLIDAQLLNTTLWPVVFGLEVTNIPAAETEIGAGIYRIPVVTLIEYTEVQLRCVVATVGPAGAVANLQASLDGTTFSADLLTPVALDALGAVASAWTRLPAAFTDPLSVQAATELRIVTSGGDGATDPVVSFSVGVR